jgi:hypothetical protein
MYPLNYVDNKTSRLSIQYSLLVTQHALTEAAYTYWDQLRINSSEGGGLYEQQPLAIRGNMKNLTDPGQDVLGFFSAASINTKRLFVQDVPGLVVNYDDHCDGPQPIGIFGWGDYSVDEYPVYFMYISGSIFILSDGCVDCTEFGGTNVKPDFWPEK